MSKHCFKSRQVIAQWREFPHPWINSDISNYGVFTAPAYVQNLTTKPNSKKPLPLSSSALTLNTCLWQWKLYMQRERRINSPPSHLRTRASTSTSSPTQQPLSPPHLPPEPTWSCSSWAEIPPFPLPLFIFQGVMPGKSLQWWHNYSRNTRGRAAGWSGVVGTIWFEQLKLIRSHLLEMNFTVVLSTTAVTPAQQRSPRYLLTHHSAWCYPPNMHQWHFNLVEIKIIKKKQCKKP